MTITAIDSNLLGTSVDASGSTSESSSYINQDEFLTLFLAAVQPLLPVSNLTEDS